MKKFIVLFAVLAMVFGMTASAVADMTPYGSIRFRTYTQDTDKEFGGTSYDVRGTMWNMGLLSRLGFKFSSGDVGGLWEIDTGIGSLLSTPWADIDSNRWGDIRVRHAYGYWNFGAGQLLIGQTGIPTDLSIGTVYWTGNVDMGWGAPGLQTARPMQLRLTFGSLKVAFITPYTTTSGVWGSTDAVDVTLPKIELGYGFKMENMAFTFGAGYQTYEERDAPTDTTQDVDAYLLAARFKGNFDAFYVGVVLSYAQNARQYGMEYTDNINGSAVWHTGTMHDAETMTAGIALGYKVSDTVYLQGGYYLMDSENDANGTTKYEDEAQAYFVNCKVKLADNVYVIPEITVTDRDDSTWGATTATKQGKQTTAGVFWVINFK